MNRSLLASAAALVSVVLSAAPAFACIGQIKILGGALGPGEQVQVRGYGFWADPRPVALSWDGGTTVTTVQPDAAGTFTVALTLPDTEGAHRLVATQGESDPEPAYNLVQVTRAAAVSDTPAASVAETPSASEARWSLAAGDGVAALALGGLALALALALRIPALGRARRSRAT